MRAIPLLQYEGEAYGSLGMRYRLGVLFNGRTRPRRVVVGVVIFARKYVLVTFVVLFSDQAHLGSYLNIWLLEACSVLHLFVRSSYAFWQQGKTVKKYAVDARRTSDLTSAHRWYQRKAQEGSSAGTSTVEGSREG